MNPLYVLLKKLSLALVKEYQETRSGNKRLPRSVQRKAEIDEQVTTTWKTTENGKEMRNVS